MAGLLTHWTVNFSSVCTACTNERSLHMEAEVNIQLGLKMQKMCCYFQEQASHDAGGFFLAGEIFGRMFDKLFPACTFFFS